MTIFLDRCIWTATAGGLADFAVASAVTGYLTPAQASATNGAYRYFAQSDDLSQWEVGSVGTWDGTTLARTTIEFSSNSNNKVNFSAAPKVYMGGPLAADMSAGSGISAVVDDTSPQLGGDLDPNGHTISAVDEAYDATGWNGNLTVPTKNAIRDKFESISASPWVVIGDTTVSSPVSSIEQDIDLSLYAEIRVSFIDLVNAASDNAMGMNWGYQIQKDDDTILYDVAGAFVANEDGAIEKIRGALTFLLSGSSSSVLLVKYDFNSSATGHAVSDKQDSANTDLSEAGKLVFFFCDNDSSFNVATATNTTAGRLITYGLRLP